MLCRFPQERKLLQKNRGPALITRLAHQVRCAIRAAGFAIELMREFMQHHVVTMLKVNVAMLDMIPCQDHAIIIPGFAQQGLMALRDQPAGSDFGTRHNEGRWIYQDEREIGIHLGGTIQ